MPTVFDALALLCIITGLLLLTRGVWQQSGPQPQDDDMWLSWPF